MLLGALDAVLADALVDSRYTQNLGLPEAGRRLIQTPVRLALEPDPVLCDITWAPPRPGLRKHPVRLFGLRRGALPSWGTGKDGTRPPQTLSVAVRRNPAVLHTAPRAGTRQSRKFRSSYVADAGGSVSEAMHAVSRRRI